MLIERSVDDVRDINSLRVWSKHPRIKSRHVKQMIDNYLETVRRGLDGVDEGLTVCLRDFDVAERETGDCRGDAS